MILVSLLHGWLGYLAVPVALCAAYALILVWKAIAFTRIPGGRRDKILAPS